MDQVNLVYEQDCQRDINDYESMFIVRIDLSSGKYSTTASISSMPDTAAFFGDKNGKTFGQAIAVDEYGFVYVHGQSSSPAFGGIVASSKYAWIHVKTHWELTHELQFNQLLSAYYSDPTTPSGGFIGKRFI